MSTETVPSPKVKRLASMRAGEALDRARLHRDAERGWLEVADQHAGSLEEKVYRMLADWQGELSEVDKRYHRFFSEMAK